MSTLPTRNDRDGMTVEAIRARNERLGECSECDKHLDIAALLARCDELTGGAGSHPEAYGLPATYRAAVEEVHEWREASQVVGIVTPASLRTNIVANDRHHRLHHAREERLLEAARKALVHRKKAETDGVSRIMYDFCASRYLDEMLSALFVDEEGVCVVCEAQPTGTDGRAAFCPLHRT